jgi:hypothetical protein
MVKGPGDARKEDHLTGLSQGFQNIGLSALCL